MIQTRDDTNMLKGTEKAKTISELLMFLSAAWLCASFGFCWWKFVYLLGVVGVLSEDGGNSFRCGTEINMRTKSPNRCGVFGSSDEKGFGPVTSWGL